MKKTKPAALHTPTLLDLAGRVHIAKAGEAYCGATGEQEAARAHEIDALCQRCRDARGREALDAAIARMGL